MYPVSGRIYAEQYLRRELPVLGDTQTQLTENVAPVVRTRSHGKGSARLGKAVFRGVDVLEPNNWGDLPGTVFRSEVGGDTQAGLPVLRCGRQSLMAQINETFGCLV